MTLLRGQSDISGVVPMPVDRTDDSSTVTAVSAETVVWYFLDTGAWAAAVGEAAGTIVVGKLAYTNVLNSIKSAQGSYNDTSLSFGATTRLDTLISIPEDKLSAIGFMTPTEQVAEVTKYLTTNGYYAIDHRRGVIWGKPKAIVADDAASYSIMAPVAGSGGPASNVDLIRVGGTAVTDAGSTISVPTTLTGGSKTVATSGTAEALGASLATKTIYVRAKSTNTNDVFVGDSAVDAVTNQQVILSANDSVTLGIANRSTVYVDVTTNGEGVDFVCAS